MSILSKASQISKCEKTADFYESKGKKDWAKAKNGGDGSLYNSARTSYERAKAFRAKADKLRSDK